MKQIDITDKVIFDYSDGDRLPIDRCACGAEFGSWDFTIGVELANPSKCPNCGRKMIFENYIKIYELVEE